jgi:hypothetical protein
VVRLLWQGEELDRLLDAAHAGLVDQVVAILAATDGRSSRGDVQPLRRARIDRHPRLHPEHGALLIVEVKSVMPDVQALLAGVDRKARIAPGLAADRGWRVRSVSRLIVLREDRTARRRLAAHATTFDRAYPARTRAVRRWIELPTAAMAGVLFLPASQSTGGRHRVRGRRAPVAA